MADEILVKYKVDASEFGKVGVAVNTVTAETKELQTQIKATFADKSIEAATKQLYEQGDVMGALVNKYGSATSALKAMEKELATMAALGQRGTAQFKELAGATAELKDTIGDTRGEIKKMASDTKVFDTMVQGARGVAAAFSVATGLAATFGDENKDLQKTLLKVQGAMAALQGVQELANIATEKGGIATKAYGVALTVVDKISKVTGLSMAASWALATAGITLVIAGVVALISYLSQADDKSEENAENEKKRQKDLDESITKNQTERYKRSIKALDDYDHLQEQRRKKAIINEEDLTAVELSLLNDKLTKTENLLKGFNYLAATLNKEESDSYKRKLEDRVLDTKIALKKIHDEILKHKNDGVESYDVLGPAMFKPADGSNAEPLITEKLAKESIDNGDAMAAHFKNIYNDGVKSHEKKLAEELKTWNAYAEAVKGVISSLSSLTSSIAANEIQQIQDETSEKLAQLDKLREANLKAAGDDANKRALVDENYNKKKTALERKQAIATAKIKREEAIANKAFALLNATLSTAQAVIGFLANPGGPAGIGLSVLAGITGAIEIAAIAAAPLPTIPKFEKGGAVLAGGRNDDGHLIGRSHREGGILIEAQGGEYIWDRQATAKHGDIIKAAHENRIEDLVMHKYVIPILKARTAATENTDSYDDIYLRRTIQQTSAKSAKFIVDGISSNMKESLYLANRYK